MLTGFEEFIRIHSVPFHQLTVQSIALRMCDGPVSLLEVAVAVSARCISYHVHGKWANVILVRLLLPFQIQVRLAATGAQRTNRQHADKMYPPGGSTGLSLPSQGPVWSCHQPKVNIQNNVCKVPNGVQGRLRRGTTSP